MTWVHFTRKPCLQCQNMSFFSWCPMEACSINPTMTYSRTNSQIPVDLSDIFAIKDDILHIIWLSYIELSYKFHIHNLAFITWLKSWITNYLLKKISLFEWKRSAIDLCYCLNKQGYDCSSVTTFVRF